MDEFAGKLNEISQEHVDRRRFLKRAGITAMWATPAIMTLTAGSAAASHRAAKLGQPCTPEEGGPYGNTPGPRPGHPRYCEEGLECRPTPRHGFRCQRP